MIKFVKSLTSVVLEEIPDMVSLAVEISNCQGNCVGCHSPFLRENLGEELTPAEVDRMIADNFGVNCFLFLGEGNDRKALEEIAAYIREHHAVRLALYSGRTKVEEELYDLFDYIKTGPYIAEYGPLNSRTTNQRLYRITRLADGSSQREDITSRFWKKV